MSTLTLSTVRQNLSKFDYTGLGLPALVLLIMAMLVVPLPALLLDILFTFNIACSLLIIMIAIGTRKPLEFSSFPSVLLFATMLRLGLNVASTRVILVNGHEGHEAAGKVVAAFGEFVIGGNYVVGFIIFAILMIINFIVVTKGAGRVSEVNARFTLDAMPGKQMSIDADLNAGVIDQETAKKRREELSQESDFFGSMDGASKFVSGDAVAGLLILVINLIGGLTIGVGQHGLSLADAGRIYTLLTIGDGLVAQIPSLFLSLATAIIVTRVTTSESMTEQATTQLANPTALYMSAGILAVLGLVPGMPHLVFITLALASAADCALGPMLFGLREYRGEPHRVQHIGTLNSVEFFDDSKGTNVGATVAALNGLGEDRRLVLILGGEGKGQDFQPLAAPVRRFVRAVVLIGRDAAQIAQALQALIGHGANAAFALEHFEQNGDNAGFFITGGLDRVQIVVGDFNKTFRQGTKSFACFFTVGCRQGAKRAAMPGGFHCNDEWQVVTLFVAKVTREFDGGFVSLGTTVTEQDFSHTRDRENAFSERLLLGDFINIRGMDDACCLFADRRNKLRVTMSQAGHANAGKAIEIASAFSIPQEYAFAMRKGNRKS